MSRELLSQKPANGIQIEGIVTTLKSMWEDLLRINQGGNITIGTGTGSGSIPATTNHYRVTTVSAAITLTLPASATVNVGHDLTVVVGVGAGASVTNTVTIEAAGTDVICGDNSSGDMLITENEAFVTLRYVGGGIWDVIGTNAIY